MNSTIIIIGKRSNLTNCLKQYLRDCTIVSTKNIYELENKIKDLDNINFIYNSFFQSNLLSSNETNPIDYSNYSFHYLSKFVSLCNKYHNKINAIIYSSSCAVYGDNKFAKESDAMKITSLYAALKSSSEYIINKYLGNKNINLIYARLFNLYGGNDKFSVISKIANSIKNDCPFYLINNGNNIRDFIYINDVAKIYKLILDLKFSGKINISTGRGTEIRKVINIAEKIYSKNLKVINKVSNDVKSCVGCNDIITNKLGFKEFSNLEDYFYKEINKQ